MEPPSSAVPKFVVDLSQSPEHRYDHIASEFAHAIKDSNIPGLLDELLSAFAGSVAGKVFKTITWLSLRRLHEPEETAELRGISRNTGIPMYILVAFNVLLDLLLGCTSGGVRVFEPGSADMPKSERMIHFRTLDWGMDRLRKIVVELDFVRRPDGPVVATTVTYFGYIGVLTGVRKGLSMSLNFRPRHTGDTFGQRASFRWHQAMVLLGRRQSVSSVLRGLLLSPLPEPGEVEDKTTTRSSVDETPEFTEQHMAKVLEMLSHSKSTAAYLIFCQPQKAYIVEKDHRSANIFVDDTFIAAFNHDQSDEHNFEQLRQVVNDLKVDDPIGMVEIVALSFERKENLEDEWKRCVKACRRKHKTKSDAVSLSGVYNMVQDEEVSNEETHYAVIMDPTSGQVLWRTVYELREEESGDDDEDGAEIEEDNDEDGDGDYRAGHSSSEDDRSTGRR